MSKNYRNRRTENGLKRGVRVEWDAPKKAKTKPDFDPLKFLEDCCADKEAYSAKERTGFRKVIEAIKDLRIRAIADFEEAEACNKAFRTTDGE